MLQAIASLIAVAKQGSMLTDKAGALENLLLDMQGEVRRSDSTLIRSKLADPKK